MSENTQLWNMSYLNEITGGSKEFIIEMIDVFLMQTPGYFEELLGAVQSADWKTAGDVAHKIKPTLAFMGAEQAREDMQTVERNARNLENLDSLPSKVNALHETCTLLFAQLKEYREKLETE